MVHPKLVLPLTLAVSLAGGALTAGMSVGASKDKIEQHATDITELKQHDRESNGDIRELKEDVKEVRHSLERIEQAIGTK